MTDLTVEIVRRVSRESGDGVDELPPLGANVDVDALGTIADDVSMIEFEYSGYTVVIRDGMVTVRE